MNQLMEHVGRLDSMHTVTNTRVEIDGDGAHLTCYSSWANGTVAAIRLTT